MTDKELLDWLGKQNGQNLISDDAGRWAISDAGMQPVPPRGGFKDTVSIVSLVFKGGWHKDIRSAIVAAIGGATP